MPSVFGCIPSGSRYGNVPNELVHRAGPPFLDNHYCGYQFTADDAWPGKDPLKNHSTFPAVVSDHLVQIEDYIVRQLTSETSSHIVS